MTVIAGLPIPSDSPLFLAGVGVHVLLGLACVVTGLVAMRSRKGPGRHPLFGTVYFWSLAGVFATASALAAARWPHDLHLVALGGLSFGAALLGRQAKRRPGGTRLHILGMGASYVLLLTAFYVDNGRSLPIWRDLPELAYWLLPGLVGAPFMAWALLRHPLART